MNFADFLENAKNIKGLSFRELETKSDDLDHAYIYRLAKGDKTSPSEETIRKLSTALELSNREAQVFELLAEQDIDDALFGIMIERNDIDWDTLEAAATMSNRGKRPSLQEDWLAYIKKIEDLFGD